MDVIRFERLTRVLTGAPTRRDLTRALAGLALGGALWLVPAPEAEARKGKRKKQCGPCQVRKRGKCKGPKPDETPCKGDGSCFGGACIPRPTCLGYGASCLVGGPCCSGICIAGQICLYGGPDAECYSDADCNIPLGFACVAYRCRMPAQQT